MLSLYINPEAPSLNPYKAYESGYQSQAIPMGNEYCTEEVILSYKMEDQYLNCLSAVPPLNVVSENIALPVDMTPDFRPRLLLPESMKMASPVGLSYVENNPSKVLPDVSKQNMTSEGSLFKNLNGEDIKARLEKIFVSQEIPNKNSYNSYMIQGEEGRKISLYELIITQVLPKWKQYIDSKTERREADPTKKPRADTFKKKVLRDTREFFRILFRKRFHISQYRTIEGVKSCLITFFQDLGLPLSQSDLNDYHLFRYVHQTHLYTSLKLLKKGDALDDSPFKAIEKYNDSRFRRLLKHPLCAKMFYFVFNNFLEFYYPLIKDEYKESVMSIVSMTLNLYKRTRRVEDLAKFDFLF